LEKAVDEKERKREMISSRKELKEWLDYERNRYELGGGVFFYIKYFAGMEREIIWHFQRRLRITEYYYNTNKKIAYVLSRVRLNKIENKYGLHIGINVCGKGLKIMHIGSILTNGKVRMGENVSLHINTSFVAQGVTGDVPIIGNGVVVGVGASVVGGIRIADNVAVGANAVVTKDILEENIAVAGVPAKKVSNNGRLNWNR
jgi:serine O-acetyltransferase